MVVFDTSAYVNGRRDHYPFVTFPSVWELVGAAMDDGGIVSPREALNELKAKDDQTCAWAKEHAASFLEPTEAVQREAGAIYQMLPQPGLRDAADPFVVAEAKVRGFTVVTYEGRSFSGVPTKNWSRKMPGICQHVGVPCCTLPEALALLGATF